MKYLRFIRLCYRAYSGDVAAGLEVLAILRAQFGERFGR